MRAVVLVGGKGTRLRPLTWETPKQMLTLADLTMIERVVGHLVSHGVDDVVLSMGYRPDTFLAAFPDGTCAGANIHYAVEPEPLDTAGGIRFAALDAKIDETFIVVNGDVLTDLDLSALVAFHRECGAEATISLTPVEDPSVFGVVPTNELGRVEAFIEKPPPGEAPTNLINAGTYVLEAWVIERIPDGRKVSIERETFPALVADRALFAMASDEYWLDTGTPASYLRASLDLAAGLRGRPHPEAVGQDGGWWQVGAGHIVGAVAGPSFIGEGASIAPGATIEGSVVESGASVGEGALVRSSLVCRGAEIGPGAVIEGSVVGAAATIGANARLTAMTVVQGGAAVDSGIELDGARVER
ncbi:MAG TPA: NDP-sugar synthase [Acidimicrobiales bacterium]|nr:NDP-sugar synthase [Acidimicrobiales bacterium]